MSDIARKHSEKIDKFLSTVPSVLNDHCWSEDMLSIINDKCDFMKGYYRILFPSGLEEIVAAYEDRQNRRMLEIFAQDASPKKIRDKIAGALEIRIFQVTSKAAALNHSAYFMLPTNILSGLKLAAVTCDKIWRLAGDTSTDFNYYTKRGLLLPVYLTALTYYFADESDDYAETREFIKSSLDNIINIANLKNKINLPKMEDIPILRLFL